MCLPLQSDPELIPCGSHHHSEALSLGHNAWKKKKQALGHINSTGLNRTTGGVCVAGVAFVCFLQMHFLKALLFSRQIGRVCARAGGSLSYVNRRHNRRIEPNVI